MIAVATAWFAIFMIIGVVASSYANRLRDEQTRVQNILENSQDGIICFDLESETILVVNPKCALWLRYGIPELTGKYLSSVWCDNVERERFIAGIKKDGKDVAETEGLFRARDGTILRLVLSVVMIAKNRVFCSVIDITGSKIVDEVIRKTLEDLEEQVKARTAHLEKINEDLRREILERPRFEQTILSSQAPVPDENREERQ